MNLDENMLYKRILMRLRKEMPAGSGGVGPAGRDGAQGIPGKDGIAGATGAAGRDGKDGAVGGIGPAGKDGVAGLSGAPGSKGDTGVAGRDGVDGRNGVDGAPGAAGKDGVAGAKGADGATGATGAAGTNAKRIDTYTGTTDANGLLTITYMSAFPALPSIQPEPPTAANQVWVKVTSTTTGCSLRLVQRASATVVGIEVLLATTTNVASAPARVVVIAA